MKQYEEIKKIALANGWEEDGNNRYCVEDWILNQCFIISLDLMHFITITESEENARKIGTLGEVKTLLKVFGKQKNYKKQD